MNNYTIYCTPEQTKKALKLGAPIKRIIKYEDTISSIIDYCIPTVEQMLGWIEEQMNITTFHINFYPTYKNEGYGYLIIAKEIVIECDAQEDGKYLQPSRKEATLAAIDAALGYLMNNKK